mmetsp:Transcript_14650/g.12889  ORF Transcript_14650/g.12889 Transcript_14650/m.12889 type:complete len:117 (-) Transcript_14650:113-463(-)
MDIKRILEATRKSLAINRILLNEEQQKLLEYQKEFLLIDSRGDKDSISFFPGGRTKRASEQLRNKVLNKNLNISNILKGSQVQRNINMPDFYTDNEVDVTEVNQQNVSGRDLNHYH